jgi:hypothetical protein
MPRALRLVAAFVTLAALLAAQIADAAWQSRPVALGVTWKSHRFAELFGAPQSVELLIAELREPQVAIRFAAGDGLTATSALAAPTRAIAAVNGGYFTKEAKPSGWLRIDGADLGAARPRRDAAIAVGARGRIRIGRCAELDRDETRHALSAGPLLLRDGRAAPIQGWPDGHALQRHPRTAVGLTARDELLLVTVAGRTPQAAGMTCPELAELMSALGCVAAMNLDGGGSTTMWIRGEPHGGIVNHPCDNRKFDHAGERRVANALLLLAPELIEADETDALLAPDGAWQPRPEPAALRGRIAASAAADAFAHWSIPVELTGDYVVLLRAATPAALAGARFLIDGAEIDPKAPKDGWVELARIVVAKHRPVDVRVEAGATPIQLDALRLVERVEPPAPPGKR